MKLLSSLTTKQRQRLLLAGIIVVSLSVIFLASSKDKPAKPKKNDNAGKKMTLLTDKVEKDLWVAQQGEAIKGAQAGVEQNNAALKDMQDQIRSLQAKIDTQGKSGGPQKDGKTPSAPSTEKGNHFVFPPLPMPPGKELPKDPAANPALKNPTVFPPVPQQTPGAGNHATASGEHGQMPPGAQVIPPAPGAAAGAPGKGQGKGAPAPGSFIRVFKDEETKDKDFSKDKNKKKEEPTTMLPPSFMSAVLLTGLDAPTSASSHAEPYPVLLSVTDLSTLPNLYKMNLKECFVIGAGYGNLSDERCYIRTETLSCVRKDGGVIEVGLKGNIIGEDGKLGMRGRLVSKQGQQIAMALFAGTLSGLGSAFTPQQSFSINLNPSNSSNAYSTIPADKAFEQAGLTGVGTALNKVADHFLKRAEQMFPVIEIDAGRQVEIVVLKGQQLKMQTKSGPASAAPKRKNG